MTKGEGLMLRAYKYRIYPDKEQANLFAKTFGCARYVYNYYLNKKNELYEEDKKTMSKTDCNNDLNRNLKNEFTWLREVDKFALTNSVFNLDTAYKNFFRNNIGFPKFKSKHTHRYSYKTNYTNGNIEVDFEKNKIKLPKVKWIKAKIHRTFSGIIQSAVIERVPSGRYYVSVLVKTEEIALLPKSDNVIAFDLGLKEYLVDSNGNHIPNPKYISKYENKLAKEQRKLAHKEKGSKNWNKQRIVVARIHEKIGDVRKNHAEQLSSKIIKENQIIISEDLQISNMIKCHNLAKSIADVAWGSFLQKLEYKAKWYGRTYHKISPWYASSQICSCCGQKNPKIKLLSIREWECDCGSYNQRDENAAKNILKEGLRELGIA